MPQVSSMNSSDPPWGGGDDGDGWMMGVDVDVSHLFFKNGDFLGDSWQTIPNNPWDERYIYLHENHILPLKTTKCR